MSRAGNLMGQFYTEGIGATPWSAEDEDRFRGRFKIGGQLTRPHVNTPRGPFLIGIVPLRAKVNFLACPDCGERKVRLVDKRMERYRCDGCGQEHGLQYLQAKGCAVVA